VGLIRVGVHVGGFQDRPKSKGLITCQVRPYPRPGGLVTSSRGGSDLYSGG
jgi:hypothetical protein